MSNLQAVVAVHFNEDGEISYRVVGGDAVRLFIVDDRAPNDRVYEWLPRDPAEALRELIPAGAEIGNSQDARHAAIAHRIMAEQEGRAHLSALPDTLPR